MSDGEAQIIAAVIGAVGAVLTALVVYWLSRRRSSPTAAPAVAAQAGATAAAQARADYEQLDARREAERERERTEDKDEILRSRTEVERLRAELAERDARIVQLLSGRNV